MTLLTMNSSVASSADSQEITQSRKLMCSHYTIGGEYVRVCN